MTAQAKGVDVLSDLRGVVRIAKAASIGNTGNAPRIERAEAAIVAIAGLIEAVKTQRTIAEDSGPWNWPGACQTYAVLVGLPACPCPSRAAITQLADDNVAAALARVGGAQ